MNILFAFILSLFSINAYSRLVPVELFFMENQTTKEVGFTNTSKHPMLYQVNVIQRFPDKNNKMKINKKITNKFLLSEEDFIISPKRFIVKPNKGQKIKFILKETSRKKLKERGHYFASFIIRFVAIARNANKETAQKLQGALVAVAPSYISNIFITKGESTENENIKISAKYQNNQIKINLKRKGSFMGLGGISIYSSVDQNKWKKVFVKDYKVYNKEGSLTVKKTKLKNLQKKEKYLKIIYRDSYHNGGKIHDTKILKIK